MISEEVLVRHYVNNKASLVGLRSKTIACDVESCKLVEKVLEDVPTEIGDAVWKVVARDAVSWYVRLSDSKKEENKRVLLEYLESLSLEKLSFSGIWNELKGDAEALLGKKWKALIGYDYCLSSEERLMEIVTQAERIIIYGAGQVAEAFLEYLSEFEMQYKKVTHILVSDCKKNVKLLQGIPVIERRVKNTEQPVTVIIATLENVHREILANLIKDNYSNVFYISERLYQKIRKDI